MFRYLVMLSFGLTAAILAGYLTWQRIEAAESRVVERSYLVYAIDAGEQVVRAGNLLSSSEVVAVSFPVSAAESFGVPLIEANEENRLFVTLQPVNGDVVRGRPLTWDLFEDIAPRRLSEVVTPGMRAMTLPINRTSSLDNQLVPGDRIDLMSALEGDGGVVVELVLADVRVIGVGEHYSFESFNAARRRDYDTITIEITPDNAMMLAGRIEELSRGFAVALRQVCDTSLAPVGCN
jgi:Flp pilus assembly protein CpaB